MLERNDSAPDESENPLTDRQRRFLVELIRTPEIQSAARAAGVGRTTAYRWLGQPLFAAELARMRDAALSEAFNAVKLHASRAAQELANLMDTKDERLRRYICNDILRQAAKVRELEEIERRVTLLEKSLQLRIDRPC